MKKRLTLNLSAEVVKYVNDTAKVKGITASQLFEDVFIKIIMEEEEKNNLKKVS